LNDEPPAPSESQEDRQKALAAAIAVSALMEKPGHDESSDGGAG